MISREFYVHGTLPKHQRSDCGAQSPWQKSSADFYNIANPFLHCLVYFVLILHWHQDFRVLKLYQTVYKKIPIRYWNLIPIRIWCNILRIQSKNFQLFREKCQCDCSFTSPSHLCALIWERDRVQYATHFLGSMRMMFYDELTWLSLQGNCVSWIGTQVQQRNHIEINTCISRFSLSFFGKKFPPLPSWKGFFYYKDWDWFQCLSKIG